MKVDKVGILRKGFTFKLSPNYHIKVPKNSKVVVSNGVLRLLVSNGSINVKRAIYNTKDNGSIPVFTVFFNRSFLGVIPISSFNPSIPYPLSMLS